MALVVGGYTLPTPKLNGVTVKEEKIWSKKTGRGAAGNGMMLGDIVGIKTTLSVQWGPLSESEKATIMAACRIQYPTISYPEEGINGVFYSGTPSFTTYSYVAGKKYSSGQVDFIMR